MRDAEARFQQKGAGGVGVNIVAIGLGGTDYARQFREETKIPFPLLIDEGSVIHKAAGLGKANVFHLFRTDNFASRKRAKAGGHRQHQLGKDPFDIKDPFQLGGSFVFGPGNIDRFAHLSKTFGDNASIEALLAALPA